MADLITIGDLEDALGYSAATPAEEARWEHYITAVSSFINSYVDVSFEEIEDDEVRLQADYYGLIYLGGDPISTVSSISIWRTGAPHPTAEWNGLDEISGLQPLQVVDVVYTHGYSTVPEDIANVVVESVLGILQLGANGPLKSITVGDVTEAYAVGVAKPNPTAGVTLAAYVLDSYRDTEYTIRLGARWTQGTDNTLPIP